MAFPIVEATATSEEATATTTHDVALPAGIEAGDLLIVITFPETSVLTPPEGWTDVGGGDAFYREADGSEGASVQFTGESQISVHHSYRISGHQGAPESSTAASGSDASPNPPSLAPSWGEADTLWIAWAVGIGVGSSPDFTAAPSSYTNLIEGTVVTAASTLRYLMASARRELTAETEDPGTFTASNVVAWVSNTIAVAPAGTVVPTARSIIGRGLTQSVLLHRRRLIIP